MRSQFAHNNPRINYLQPRKHKFAPLPPPPPIRLSLFSEPSPYFSLKSIAYQNSSRYRSVNISPDFSPVFGPIAGHFEAYCAPICVFSRKGLIRDRRGLFPRLEDVAQPLNLRAHAAELLLKALVAAAKGVIEIK